MKAKFLKILSVHSNEMYHYPHTSSHPPHPSTHHTPPPTYSLPSRLAIFTPKSPFIYLEKIIFLQLPNWMNMIHHPSPLPTFSYPLHTNPYSPPCTPILPCPAHHSLSSPFRPILFLPPKHRSFSSYSFLLGGTRVHYWVCESVFCDSVGITKNRLREETSEYPRVCGHSRPCFSLPVS